MAEENTPKRTMKSVQVNLDKLTPPVREALRACGRFVNDRIFIDSDRINRRNGGWADGTIVDETGKVHTFRWRQDGANIVYPAVNRQLKPTMTTKVVVQRSTPTPRAEVLKVPLQAVANIDTNDKNGKPLKGAALANRLAKLGVR